MFCLLNLESIQEGGANYLTPYMSSHIPKNVLNAARTQHSKNSAVDHLGEAVFKNTPSAPLNLRAAIVATRFITLSWSMPSNPNGDLSGYSVFYKEIGSDRYVEYYILQFNKLFTCISNAINNFSFNLQ